MPATRWATSGSSLRWLSCTPEINPPVAPSALPPRGRRWRTGKAGPAAGSAGAQAVQADAGRLGAAAFAPRRPLGCAGSCVESAASASWKTSMKPLYAQHQENTAQACARQGQRVADCAHVPRGGLRPPLLLYFATSATRRPWRETLAVRDRRTPLRFSIGSVGCCAQRSKEEAPAAGRRRGT